MEELPYQPESGELLYQRYPESKVFVTGVYGSGKTLFALKYASIFKVKYINFDKYFNYSSLDQKVNAAKDLLNVLSDNFIADAIPVNFNFGFGYEDFLDYVSVNNVRVVCTVCPNPDIWKERAKLPSRKLQVYQGFVDYAKFYFSLLPLIAHLPIEYVDTCSNEFITKEQLYERISWIKPLLNFI